MLILVKPSFMFVEAGVDVTKFITTMPNQDRVIEIITNLLTSPAYFPGRQVQHLGTTNFLTITTLPDERLNMINDIYISKLQEYITDFMQQSELNVNNNLTFATLTKPNSREHDDLTDAVLSDPAVITGLKDSGDQLIDLNLEDVYLNDSDYVGANFFESKMNRAQMSYAILIAATFNEATLQRAILSGSDLRYASFYNADLRGAKLNDTELKEANLMNTSLIGADLQNADLRHSTLIGSILTNADLRGADLRNAHFDDRTSFINCLVSSETKFGGSNWQDARNNGTINEADFTEDLLEEEMDLDEDEDATDADELADLADEELEQMPEQAQGQVLAPLEITPDSKINNGINITYEDILSLLVPKFNSVKIPISQMQLHNWYGIASLGNTPPDIWQRNNVVPSIGKVFKCLEAPIPSEGEAIVYQSTPACMSVHELSRKLDINSIFTKFKEVIPDGPFDSTYTRLREGKSTEKEVLEAFGIYLYKELFLLLGDHNADEPADAWTHVFDDVEQRKKFVKHAVFHKDEGIMNHPKFDSRLQNTFPEHLLVIALFIEELPLQVQVKWAQNYIKEFITGYDQELETFDPTQIMPMGFIASCLNGNLEKLLLTISGAITYFYPQERPVEESGEDKLQLLKKNITDSEFNKYFITVQLDPAGPTFEGYRRYIQTTPDLNTNEERRQQFLTLLEDPDIIAKIEETIGFMSGGRRRKNKKRKTIKERKTIKKHTIKKHTIKKHKKYNNNKKKTIKKKNNNKNKKKTIKKK
jgi:uncharacterized protein YjbI with pentapeptide repeats